MSPLTFQRRFVPSSDAWFSMKNETEARAILAMELETYQNWSYGDLVARLLDTPVTTESVGPSGTRWQIEAVAFWDTDTKPNGDLRVVVAIDDGSFWGAVQPLATEAARPAKRLQRNPPASHGLPASRLPPSTRTS